MTCAACQSRVQRTLQKQPGVQDEDAEVQAQRGAVGQHRALVQQASALVDVQIAARLGEELGHPGDLGAVLGHMGLHVQARHLGHETPGHGELLIKVTACGVCHSDLHAVDGDWTPPPVIPLIPGHEVAGTVAKLARKRSMCFFLNW